MLKAIFGLMGLLIVLAIIGTLGKTQLQALGLTRDATTRVKGQGAERSEERRVGKECD